VKELAAQGCHVVLAARSKDKLDVLAKETASIGREERLKADFFYNLSLDPIAPFSFLRFARQPVRVVSARQLPGLRSLRAAIAGQMGRAAFGFKRVIHGCCSPAVCRTLSDSS